MIFVLDSNVISEIMKPRADASVLAWIDARAPADLHTTAITRAEIFYGIRQLDEGRQRVALEQAATSLFELEFDERILAFDSRAADHCADVRVQRLRAGRPISHEDAMIAGIVRAHRGTIVTRDEGGFEACGVPVINPWTHGTRQ